MKIVKIDELKEFEGLDPSIYSKRKFIEFIARYLKAEGGISKEYNFIPGKNIRIDSVAVSEMLTNVTIAYEKSETPTGDISQFTAEYGKTFAPGAENINISVNRKTYPLELLSHPNVEAPVNLGKADLEYLQNGDTIALSRTNKNAIGPDDTIMADGGIFRDSTGQGGSLVSKINRQTRIFYGTTAIIDPSEDFFNTDKYTSKLGGVPSKISVSVGSVSRGFQPEHLVIITTGNVKVTQNGGEILMDKQTVEISSYQPNPQYKKTYNLFTSKSTMEPGPADFDVA